MFTIFLHENLRLGKGREKAAKQAKVEADAASHFTNDFYAGFEAGLKNDRKAIAPCKGPGLMPMEEQKEAFQIGFAVGLRQEKLR